MLPERLLIKRTARLATLTLPPPMTWLLKQERWPIERSQPLPELVQTASRAGDRMVSFERRIDFCGATGF
jgi:hypothetical protein